MNQPKYGAAQASERLAENRHGTGNRYFLCRNGCPVAWSDFLVALEQFCSEQGWILEYESVNDESCAIFYRAPPTRKLAAAD